MKLRRCLACDSKRLEKVLDLGKQPLANNYGQKKKYPLVLNGCLDCGHGQLSISVNPKKLFSHYLYESGTSNTLKQWFDDFAKSITYLYGQGSILDIASNDGTFLRSCKELGWTVMGVDPAKNLKPTDIPTATEFFGEYSDLGKYDVVTAFNVIAHTPNPLSILRGVRKALNASGRAFIMCSQGHMYETGQFDTIYHEHHSFYTPNSFTRLANRAGLVVVNVTEQDIHGGSLLFEVVPNQFDGFKALADGVIDSVRNFIPKNRLVALGAAAKGVVFINATGLPVTAVYDEARIKHGYNLPGTKAPILPFAELYGVEEPLTFVVTAWNFFDELVSKVKELRPNKDDEFVRFYEG